jgi:hypothetical protein
MNQTIRLITLASSLLLSSFPASAAEQHEILISGDSETNTLTLATGETAKLVYAQNFVSVERPTESVNWGPDGLFLVTTRGKSFSLRVASASSGNPPGTQTQAPIVIPGPATIQIQQLFGSGSASIATFAVTRVGTASPPAEVPQEAGSNFDVILEQSSDLVNWTPANPGTYSGAETKRFFRTRIVKKP